MSQIDNKWEVFFKHTNVLKQIEAQGYSYVKASELKRIANFEPRLLAKQDSLEERPKVFKNNMLALLPVENGKYIIYKDHNQESFFKFSDQDRLIQPQTYTSLVDLNSFSTYPGALRLTEGQAIDFAFVSSLLRHYTREEELNLTIRGRTRAQPFEITLPGSTLPINISGVQIEVDAGYESSSAVYLIEAKIGLRDSFNLRQLYYPYLNWKTSQSKRIVPIFLVYTNSKYYFYEFSFTSHFGEVSLARRECFTVNESPIATISITSLLESTVNEGEPQDIPYPQANDLDKVIDTLTAIRNGTRTKQDIANFFEFDERQGDYYPNACRYLNFVEKFGRNFELSLTGAQFLEISSASERTRLIVSTLVKRTTFRELFVLLKSHGWDLDEISDDTICRVVATNTSLSSITARRRASTVKQWLRWILNNTIFV